MGKNNKIFKFIFMVFFVIFLFLIFQNSIIVIILQNKAGKLLDVVGNKVDLSDKNLNFYCLAPEIVENNRMLSINQAIGFLERARSKIPDNAHTNLLLARAFCLKRDYKSAIINYNSYLEIKPDNPLGRVENGFAFFSFAKEIQSNANLDSNWKTKYDEYLEKSHDFFDQVGLNEESFINQAENAFHKKNSHLVYQYFLIGNSFDEQISEISSFHASLLELLIDGRNNNFNQNAYKIFEFEPGSVLEIFPQDMVSLANTKPLSVVEINNIKAGIITTNITNPVAMIEFLGKGEYCVTVNTIDLSPKPTILEINLDLEPIKTLELVEGNGTMVENVAEIKIESGFHTIGINLLNDFNKNGIDRNGYIESIRISQCD